VKLHPSRLDPGRQALLVLAHLRNGDTYTRLAAGFGIGVATVYRYIREALDLLASAAITLDHAVYRASRLPWVILDGTLMPPDRVAEGRSYYSGKHKRHGVNVQILADTRGRLLWASPALPGSTHDLTAARRHGIPAALVKFGGACYADNAYRGRRTNHRRPVPPTTPAPCPSTRRNSTRITPATGHPANAPWPSSRRGSS
jgi:DDE superfamily endonuclease